MSGGLQRVQVWLESEELVQLGYYTVESANFKYARDYVINYGKPDDPYIYHLALKVDTMGVKFDHYEYLNHGRILSGQKIEIPPGSECFEEPSTGLQIAKWRVLKCKLEHYDILFDMDLFEPCPNEPYIDPDIAAREVSAWGSGILGGALGGPLGAKGLPAFEWPSTITAPGTIGSAIYPPVTGVVEAVGGIARSTTVKYMAGYAPRTGVSLSKGESLIGKVFDYFTLD